MKVKELIQELKKFDQEKEVVVKEPGDNIYWESPLPREMEVADEKFTEFVRNYPMGEEIEHTVTTDVDVESEEATNKRTVVKL